MLVKVDASVLGNTKWHEYAVRFLLGGLITVVAGLIARSCGPSIGGLFLAFPAIFPAAATLAEQSEIDKKKKMGLNGRQRGIDAAAAEAVGTASGSFGLLTFAFACWRLIPGQRIWAAFLVALVCWGVVASAVWFLRKRGKRLSRSSKGA